MSEAKSFEAEDAAFEDTKPKKPMAATQDFCHDPNSEDSDEDPKLRMRTKTFISQTISYRLDSSTDLVVHIHRRPVLIGALHDPFNEAWTFVKSRVKRKPAKHNPGLLIDYVKLNKNDWIEKVANGTLGRSPPPPSHVATTLTCEVDDGPFMKMSVVSGFPDQVGGHYGILALDDGHVVKPWNDREQLWYEYIAQHDGLKAFAPNYCGNARVSLEMVKTSGSGTGGGAPAQMAGPSSATDLVHLFCDRKLGCHARMKKSKPRLCFRLVAGELQATSEEGKPVPNTWAVACQLKTIRSLLHKPQRFMVLENLTNGYKKPSVLDLKMGTRQYDDDASSEKKKTQTEKCRTSTSLRLGVRLVGMQLYRTSDSSYTFYDKEYGRGLNELEFLQLMTTFAKECGPQRTAVLRERLHAIRDLMHTLDGHRFYSSSILVVFDGAVADDADLRVKMIDFAHSTCRGMDPHHEEYCGPDEGYLLGLKTLDEAIEKSIKVLRYNEVQQNIGFETLARVEQ